MAHYLRPLSPRPTPMKADGRLKKPVRCILFDVYGTMLISASGDIADNRNSTPPSKALEALLKKHDLSMSAVRLVHRLRDAVVGEHAQMLGQGIAFPEVRIDRIWQSILGWPQSDRIRAFALEYELIVNPVWPMPGLRALIAAFRRRQIAMGMISNAQFFTPIVFEHLLGSDLRALGFDPRLVCFSYEFGRAKPAPTLFRQAVGQLAAMGITPAETVFVGNDMRNDIVPARQVGFQTVLFAGDARSLRLRETDPCCKDVSPDLVITELPQLARCMASVVDHSADS